MKIPMAFMVVGAAFALTAYASPDDGDQTRTAPGIETQASSRSHVHAAIQRDNQAWKLYGEVHTSHHGMGSIPGHVDIEVLAADGRVLARTSNGYQHRSRRSRYRWFLVELPEPDQPAATIRVIHHSAGRTHTPVDS